MTAKDAIHGLVDEMSEEDAERLLDFLHLQADPDELSDEDVADILESEAAFARGDFLTGAEVIKKYNIEL